MRRQAVGYDLFSDIKHLSSAILSCQTGVAAVCRAWFHAVQAMLHDSLFLEHIWMPTASWLMDCSEWCWLLGNVLLPACISVPSCHQVSS